MVPVMISTTCVRAFGLFQWHIKERTVGLTRAPLGYSAERAPLGGGRFCPPCLTPETDGRRKTGTNGERKLSTRQILETRKILLIEVRGQVRVR